MVAHGHREIAKNAVGVGKEPPPREQRDGSLDDQVLLASLFCYHRFQGENARKEDTHAVQVHACASLEECVAAVVTAKPNPLFSLLLVHSLFTRVALKGLTYLVKPVRAASGSLVGARANVGNCPLAVDFKPLARGRVLLLVHATPVARHIRPCLKR